MEVKTSTKEKFTVITVVGSALSANEADDLCRQLSEYLQPEPKNLVVKLDGIADIEEMGAECLLHVQQQFYEGGASFVYCELSEELEAKLDSYGLLELMNVTPTESEAWDIVQMEEIERELLGE